MQLDLPESYPVAITVDLARRFGLRFDPSLFEGDVVIGTVLVDEDGLFFNGRRLEPPEAARLIDACKAFPGSRR